RKNGRVRPAARSCPPYAAVMATRGRDVNQESLQSLGKDTVYALDGSEPVSPDIEVANHPPSCTPIVGWEFKFGDGVAATKDVGPWGAISKVTNPISTGKPLITKESEVLRGPDGNPVGPNAKIAGAVTTELTDKEANLMFEGTLWAQGGVPGDPVLTSKFGNEFGFAALRCAISNLHGDNVELVQF